MEIGITTGICIKVGTNSKTANTAKAICVVLQEHSIANVSAIGVPAIAVATKAIASAKCLLPTMLIDIGWTEHEIEGRTLSGIVFNLILPKGA